MSEESLHELDEMAKRLRAAAHKLDRSPERDDLIREIEAWRVRLTKISTLLQKSGPKRNENAAAPLYQGNTPQTWSRG
jgi:hypothetical protein